MKYRHYLNIDPEFDVEVLARFEHDGEAFVVIACPGYIPFILTVDVFAERWNEVTS